MVSQEKQIFHCFGCGVGGDAFKFLMLIDGISFPGLEPGDGLVHLDSKPVQFLDVGCVGVLWPETFLDAPCPDLWTLIDLLRG